MNESIQSLKKKLDDWAKSRKVQNTAYIIAMGLFVFGLTKSLSLRPDIFDHVRIIYIPFLIIFIILSFLSTALRFKIASKVIEANFSLWESIKITVLSGAANMLPVPGGLVVRVAAMVKGGSSLRKSVGINFELMFSRFGVCFILASVAAVTMKDFSLFLITFSIGLFGVTATCWLLHRRTQNLIVDFKLLSLQFALGLLDSIRIFICFLAIGDPMNFVRLLGLSPASVTGSIVSIVPAGLGIREGASALLAMLFEIKPENAYLATALNRFFTLAIILILAGIILKIQTTDEKEQDN